jgi:hypothetical protein
MRGKGRVVVVVGSELAKALTDGTGGVDEVYVEYLRNFFRGICVLALRICILA